VIKVQGLVKWYGDRCAIRGVDFEVESGHVVGFLGLNGAGKTSILRMLAGDLEPSAGIIEVDGRQLFSDPQAYRKAVGFLPEAVPLYLEMTVTEYLQFIGALRGVSKSILRTRIPEVCERVAIEEYRHDPIRHLSHGFRKRLGIGSAIIHDPDLVILDEAISGLDPVQIVEMRSLVRGLAGNHTVLVSSHILTEISRTCDRILVLKDGTIGARGTEDELRARFGDIRAIDLTVRGTEEAATAAVQGITGVDGVKLTDKSNGAVQLRLSVTADVREAVAAAVVGAGLGVLELSRTEGELERAFLELTRADAEGQS
jgi:ABC-2 type transport system ATP-binding protein